jgi:hypothetical protein
MRQENKPEYMIIREGPHMNSNGESGYFVLNTQNILGKYCHSKMKIIFTNSNISGRGVVASLNVLSVFVSRNQCNIMFDPNSSKWYIRDNGSLNGTYINNTRLTPENYHEINIDDRIGLGISWSSYHASLQMMNANPQYYVYRFALSYPFNGAAINALCADIMDM